MNIQWRISQSEAGKFMQTCEAIIRNVDGGTKAATTQACEEILFYSMTQCPVDTGALISTGDYIVERRGDVAGYRYQGIIGYAGFGRIGLTNKDSATGRYQRRTVKPDPKGSYLDVKIIRGRTTFGPKHGKPIDGKSYTTLERQDARERVYTWKGARITNDRVNVKTGLPVSAYAVIVHEDLDMRHPRGGKAKFLEDPVREYGQAHFKRVAESHWRWAIEFTNREGYTAYGRIGTITEPAFSLVKLTKVQAHPHGPRGSTIV